MRLVTDAAWAIMNVWMEARGEPYDGKVAVARVMRNRLAVHWSGAHSIADVILSPYQFSGWNTKDPNRLRAAKLDDDDPLVQECGRAWLESEVNDAGVGDAVFYYAPAAVPSPPTWAVPGNLVTVIGAHHFFTA